jgi:hypothetical protein
MLLAAEECNCRIAINSKEKALQNQESFQMLRFPVLPGPANDVSEDKTKCSNILHAVAGHLVPKNKEEHRQRVKHDGVS